MIKKIFIGGAWPYANYSLHVGHLAALLPGDILARYFRLNGDIVIYVSGTDSHGTPITERAKRENVEPYEIAKKYHDEFVECFNKLKFTYNLYTATFTDYHKKNVQDMLVQIYNNGYLYSQVDEQDYCETCGKFLADRELGGICPICGNEAKGDQCDACLTSFEAKGLKEKKCLSCSNKTVLKPNKHMVFALSTFQDKIHNLLDKNGENWRLNAINETRKYLEMGLQDRVATRDLLWGIDVPFEGYDDKKIYVWFEAVLGYITTGKCVAEKNNIDFNDFMSDSQELESYYVHGKDNIPFHTVIFPALLSALNTNIQLPKHIISCEYVNMNEEKMSKSKGNLITAKGLIEEFSADTIRFYIIANNPERKDVNFSSEEMISMHNKFLVGGFGNFVNRNISFLKKKFDGIVPKGIINQTVINETVEMYNTIGAKIQKGEFRFVVEEMIKYIQFANRYYDECKPWIQVKESISDFNNTTVTCLYIMANMTNLFAPVIPDGAQQLKNILSISESSWAPINIPDNLVISDCTILYDKIEIK
ncbi:methionine--tRNA ligase [Cellulosilyticum sp. I15G10I2]|uniref:methionine--tRNA ligase n=1 Tax=Cellulosilyticum sp. I15G10I2 TaxID=1892843 RepID=UPI00085C7BE4|nr:methionine--tRNA ligase [Cellulosilyticum sp. I15G10I2]